MFDYSDDQIYLKIHEAFTKYKQMLPEISE